MRCLTGFILSLGLAVLIIPSVGCGEDPVSACSEEQCSTTTVYGCGPSERSTPPCRMVPINEGETCFVDGVSGEQFALPEAISELRAVRKKTTDGELITVSAADPLNLVGILLPGERVASIAKNRLLFRDGVPVAAYAGREVRFLAKLDAQSEWSVRNTLLRRRIPSGLRAGAEPLQ